MRKSFFISFLFFISVSVFAQQNKVAEMLIPEPVSVSSGTGNFFAHIRHCNSRNDFEHGRKKSGKLYC